jgi:hypothetical protein
MYNSTLQPHLIHNIVTAYPSISNLLMPTPISHHTMNNLSHHCHFIMLPNWPEETIFLLYQPSIAILKGCFFFYRKKLNSLPPTVSEQHIFFEQNLYFYQPSIAILEGCFSFYRKNLTPCHLLFQSNTYFLNKIFSQHPLKSVLFYFYILSTSSSICLYISV